MPYKDPEKQRAYHQAYHQAHKEEINLRHKAWREAYPTYHKEYCATHPHLYYEANPTRQSEYYEANKERMKAHSRKWKKANPEKRRESRRKQRALKRTTQVEPINGKVVYLRDGWICQICHKRVDKRFKHPNPMSASLDHIIPLSEGGTHTYKNVQLAHLSCNINKYTNILPQGEQIRLF